MKRGLAAACPAVAGITYGTGALDNRAPSRLCANICRVQVRSRPSRCVGSARVALPASRPSSSQLVAAPGIRRPELNRLAAQSVAAKERCLRWPLTALSGTSQHRAGAARPHGVACDEEADDRLGVGWGLALAPAGFGAFSHHLQAGNVGGPPISACASATGAFPAPVHGPRRHPVTIYGCGASPSAATAWPATSPGCSSPPAATAKRPSCATPSSPHSTDGWPACNGAAGNTRSRRPR
jgi:hypothetical protein